MEIIVLVVVWLIAAFSASENEVGFALFLVFASLGWIVWRWRGKTATLAETIERNAEVTDGLRAELKNLTLELRQLKASLDGTQPSPIGSEQSPVVARQVPAVPSPTLGQAAAAKRAEDAPKAAPPSPAEVQPAVVSKLVDLPKSTVTPMPVGVAPVFAASAAAPPSAVEPPRPALSVAAPAAPSFRLVGVESAPAKAPATQKLKKSLDLEELVGRNLLPKAGIFLLVIGSVSLIATQWQNIPAFGKDLLLLAAGGLLLGLGIFLEKREKYQLFGRVLIGGGWAMLFYTSYALYHVSATRVLPAQWIDLVIMLATAAAMVWHTLKYRSQLVTGIAYLLAFSTVTISQESVFSLTAGAVLATSLIILVRRMRWYELEVFGILASYLNHFRFLFPIIGMGNEHQMFPQFYASTTLLLFYWAIFRASYVLRKIESKHEENISTVACLLNSFLLLGLMKYQSVHPQLAFYALLVLGVIEFTLGQLPVTARRRIAFLILTTLGSTLMIAAVPFKFSGTNTAVLWLAGAEALLISGLITREVAFRRIGMLAGLLTAGHIFVVDVRPWFESILNGSSASHDLTLGTLLIFCSSVIFCDAHLLELRWRDLFSEKWDRWLLTVLSCASGLVAFSALWILLPQLAVVVGWSGLMLAFAFAGKRLQRTELTIQTALLGLGAAIRVFAVNLQADTSEVAATRLWTVAVVASLFYLSARFKQIQEFEEQLRALFQWTATAMVAALLWVELPAHWVAPAWTLFAIALTLAARQLRVPSLLYQCYALSAASLVAALGFNWPLEQSAEHLGLSLRLITVALTAAGFYLLSIIAQPQESDTRTVFRGAFNTGATLLLGGLIWFEAGETWAPVFWSAFATALLILWRKLDFTEFFWHAHALAVAALIDAYLFNMFLESRVHGVSARLITVLLAAMLFYFDAWLAREHAKSEWVIQISVLYSWAASLLITTLMWHELRPIDVALGWAIVGVVLFEIGLDRRLVSVRWQGGVALCASFVRIFFVNLNAIGEPGHLSPRVYSIVPLALIYLYVYWRTLVREEAFGPSRWKQLAPMIFSSLGVASISFLIRFEVPAPSVVVFWAALTVVLLAVANWSRQAVFLYQAIILAVCTTVRAAMYNLIMPSYFSQTDVRARTLGEVIALFFASLFFAFRLRANPPENLLNDNSKWRLILNRITARPEQLFFFVAVALLTPLIAVEMRRGEITVGWGVEAVLVFVLALIVGERSFRLCGLGLLLLCLGKLCVNVWNMNTGDRTISMTVLGAVLLLVSFLYNRYRETFRKFL